MENQEVKVLKSQEQLKAELSAPLPAEAVKPHPTKTYLSSIKAIYVTERLNDVFGIGKWTNEAAVVSVSDSTGNVVIYMTLTVPDYGIILSSFGGNDNGGATSKGFDLGDAYKGAHTDALTKIGSFLGIAVEVFQGKVTGKTPPPKPTPPTAKAPVTSAATKAQEAQTESLKGIANLPKVVEASKAQTGTPAAGITPNVAFDKSNDKASEGKPEQTEDEKRQILLNYLNKVGAAKVLAHLLKVEKLRYVSVGEFVAAEPIDRIKAVYEAVREKK